MLYIDNILFFIILCISLGLFMKNMKKVYQNISLGQEIPYLEKKKKGTMDFSIKNCFRTRKNKQETISWSSSFLCLYWIFYYQFRII